MGEDHPSRTPVLVSACLLGCRCRYDGDDSRDRRLERELAERGMEAVAFCPEEFGGLGTPRPAASIAGGDAEDVVEGRARVRTADGDDVTAEFLAGARGAVALCQRLGIERAHLKERSPSCGVAATHVDGRRVDGPGVTAAALRRAGVQIRGEEGRRS